MVMPICSDITLRDTSYSLCSLSSFTALAVYCQIPTHCIQGKRLFIKDITHYLVPPEGKPASIAPSLGGKRVKKGVGTDGDTNGVNGVNGILPRPYPYDTEAEPGNPTVVPASILKQFHFTFLIRHPRNSIPSYWRCTIPPLDTVTGFFDFMPSEAGYDELRRVFDFLRTEQQVGPAHAGEHGDLKNGEVSITVVDADDLLNDPEGIIKAYCKEVGIDYRDDMLCWDSEEDHQRAKHAFEKWRGFHEDAIDSTSLKPRDDAHVSFLRAKCHAYGFFCVCLRAFINRNTVS